MPTGCGSRWSVWIYASPIAAWCNAVSPVQWLWPTASMWSNEFWARSWSFIEACNPRYVENARLPTHLESITQIWPRRNEQFSMTSSQRIPWLNRLATSRKSYVSNLTTNIKRKDNIFLLSGAQRLYGSDAYKGDSSLSCVSSHPEQMVWSHHSHIALLKKQGNHGRFPSKDKRNLAPQT